MYSPDRFLRRRRILSGILIAFSGIFLGESSAQESPTLEPTSQLAEAKKLIEQGDTLHAAGKDREALTRAQEALNLFKLYYKRDHDDVADTILNIAILYHSTYKFDDADVYYEQARAMKAKLHGAVSSEVAQVLRFQATMRTTQGRLGDAGQLVERALEIQRKLLQANDPAIADSLIQVSNILFVGGHPNEALEKLNEALRIDVARFGESSAQVSSIHFFIGHIYMQIVQLDHAREHYQRAFDIDRQLYGENDRRIEPSLSWLANALSGLGKKTEAKADATRALQIVSPNGEDSIDAIDPIVTLAGIARDDGDYASSRLSFERVLKIRKDAIKGDSGEIAESLNDVGTAFQYEGKWTEARPYYEQALGMYTRLYTAQHPNILLVANNLGYLSINLGDVVSARRYFMIALKVLKAFPDGTKANAASTLDGLGQLETMAGSYSESRKYYQESLNIRERLLGRNHRMVAVSLSGLARIAEEQGDLKEAQDYRSRILDILIHTVGKKSPHFWTATYESGQLMERLGKYETARIAYTEAYENFAKVFGHDHPQLTKESLSLALLDWRLGDYKATTLLLRDAAENTDHEIRLTLPNLSFAEQRLFVEERLPARASVLFSYSATNPALLPEFYNSIFRWKGILIENLRLNSQLSVLADDPKYKDTVEKLKKTRSELAGWYHRIDSMPHADWAVKNEFLSREKEQLERSLESAVPNANSSDALLESGLSGFRQMLRENEAYVDVYKYHRYEQGKSDVPRFLAVVVTRAHQPIMKDLAAAADIDELVSTWRSAVFRGTPAIAEWESLRRSLWDGIAEIIPQKMSAIWIAPDAELSRIPWNVFPASDGVVVSVVDSAREIANLRKNRADEVVTRGALLVGGINYGSKRGTIDLPIRFGPLKATAAEINSIEMIAKASHIDVSALTSDQPTKAAVRKALPTYKYIHLATHGFFLSDVESKRRFLPEPQRSVYVESNPSAGRNPLVESGIALAGANVRMADDLADNGLLTAEELVGVNLSGADLLVVSACDSGRGTEVTGQGVLGLRASVMAAGAHSMLMSLWKVPDEATSELMTEFYRNLWINKMPKAQALKKAQSKLTNDKYGRFTNPLNWAAWVLVGDAW